VTDTECEWVIPVVDAGTTRQWPEPETLRVEGASERIVEEYRTLRRYFTDVLPWMVKEFRS
jgi:hypothetical protein